MNKVICIASAKGGSGKTGITATIGTFLSNLNKKVLLIDADFATNGLSLFYLKESKLKAELVRAEGRMPSGLYDSLSTVFSVDIVNLSQNLAFLPASYRLSNETVSLTQTIKKRFHEIIALLRNEFDYILIDAQAGADEMAEMAISRKISDQVVIVSEYDPMSAAGVERLKALFRDELTYERTWVLLNKILPEFSQNFGDFLEVAKYLNPIPWDAEVVRAYARRKLAINTETGNEYTHSIIQIIRALFREEIESELNEWISTKAAVIRQPIVSQYEDAEAEMKFILEKRLELNKFKQTAKLSLSISIGVTSSAFFYLMLKEKSLNSTDIAIAIPILFILITITLLTILKDEFFNFFLDFFGINKAQAQVDIARYDRQLKVIEEKLRKLETLKTLDSEALLRNKEHIN